MQIDVVFPLLASKYIKNTFANFKGMMLQSLLKLLAETGNICLVHSCLTWVYFVLVSPRNFPKKQYITLIIYHSLLNLTLILQE